MLTKYVPILRSVNIANEATTAKMLELHFTSISSHVRDSRGPVLIDILETFKQTGVSVT